MREAEAGEAVGARSEVYEHNPRRLYIGYLGSADEVKVPASRAGIVWRYAPYRWRRVEVLYHFSETRDDVTLKCCTQGRPTNSSRRLRWFSGRELIEREMHELLHRFPGIRS